MNCQNKNKCKSQIKKIMKCIEKETAKIDDFLSKYNNQNQSINCDLTKDDKKKLIDDIQSNSNASRVIIEELKTHRTEVKCLSNAYERLMAKFEKLKNSRRNQLKEIEMIQCYLKNELPPKTSPETQSLESKRNHQIESNLLEKDFDTLAQEFSKLIKDYKQITQSSSNTADMSEEERDKILFCLVTKCIRRTFDIRAKVECKKANFLDYAFSDSEDDDSEDTH